MVDVLIAGIVAMVISIAAGPRFIRFLRLREYGQPIRAEGPAGHFVKQGTPTMGGLLVVFSAAIPFLILSKYSTPALCVFTLVVGCASIGFLDDYIKLTHRRSLGSERPLEAPAARDPDRGRRLGRASPPLLD